MSSFPSKDQLCVLRENVSTMDVNLLAIIHSKSSLNVVSLNLPSDSHAANYLMDLPCQIVLLMTAWVNGIISCTSLFTGEAKIVGLMMVGSPVSEFLWR